MSSANAKALLRQRFIKPLLDLLKTGATPRRLAWSLAIGIVIGINPLLGSTTILALAIASAFRLNIVASQIANHAVYPLELLLFPVFIKLGSLAFHTAALPWGRDQIFREARLHPVETTKLLWSWQWHALIVWLIFAVVVAPLLATAARPILATMLYRLGDEHRTGPDPDVSA